MHTFGKTITLYLCMQVVTPEIICSPRQYYYRVRIKLIIMHTSVTQLKKLDTHIQTHQISSPHQSWGRCHSTQKWTVLCFWTSHGTRAVLRQTSPAFVEWCWPRSPGAGPPLASSTQPVSWCYSIALVAPVTSYIQNTHTQRHDYCQQSISINFWWACLETYRGITIIIPPPTFNRGISYNYTYKAN